ncbi:ABC transporter ATP-binding protein [Treponema sp. OMZ 840]|uniref:ABC transporter ATP-binding protein n=1 Tax=Treponema sp. OMZ 840 TaxID=244313 RepID=UPI003D8B4D9F
MNTSVLKAENICKYYGGLKAVDKVSMEIEKGDIFGIIGPNGAGKTTFFNVCSGIDRPTAGKIFFCGEDITGMKPEKVAAKGMARTFQNIMLFRFMSVLENIKIGFHLQLKTGFVSAILRNKTYQNDEKFTLEKGREILAMIGLEKYANTLAGNLPYGIQRKVEIARALALDPKILLLDEPAAGMNPNETTSLSEFIIKLNDLGYTVAVIEHDMKFVMRTCKKILVLNFGQKICEGTPDIVKNNQQVREAYFGKGLIIGEKLHVEN